MTKESFGGRKPPKEILPSILLLLALTFTTTVDAKTYKYTQPGMSNPAILLEAGIEISIKAIENHEVVAAWVGGTDDHPNPQVSGRSGKTSAIQLLFPEESISWSLLFDKKSDTEIIVDRVLKFTPEKIFPPFADLNYPLSFEDKGIDDIHSSHNSFRCDHTVTRIYKSAQTIQGRVSFEVSVTVSALKVQAYNIKHGEFSPPHFCKEDYKDKPTTPSTPKHHSTESHALTTEPSLPTPKPATPKPPTTPAGPKPLTSKTYRFTQPGKSSPTIILKAGLEITIKAFEANKEVAAWVGNTNDHPNPQVYGRSGKTSAIQLFFTDESISWNLHFNKKSDKEIIIDRFLKFTPEKIFPPFADLNYPLSFADDEINDIPSSHSSFRCDHTVTRIYKPTQTLQGGISFEVTVTVAALKVQAYNVKHGEFSPPFFCKEDYKPGPTTPSTPKPPPTESHLLTTEPTLSTPKPPDTPATPKPPTTPAGPKPLAAKTYRFTQPGKSSPTIILKAGLEITIKAFEENKVVAAWVGNTNDHPNPLVYGRSGKTSAIQLFFTDESISWNLHFNKKSDKEIIIDRFLKFTPEKIFPPFADLNYPLSFADDEINDIPSSHNSLRCDHTVSRIYKPTQTLQGGISFEVNVTVAALQVQAYNVKHGKFGPPFFCKEDYKPGPTTPSTPKPPSTESHLLTTDTTLTTPTTSTTPTPTTTPAGPKPPKAKSYRFTQPGKSSPTIILKAGLEITIKAFGENKVVAEWVGNTDDLRKPDVYGRSGKTSVIQLLFPKESISWILHFNEKSDKEIIIDRVLKFTPEKIFPPFADLNYPLSFADDEINDIPSSHNSFRCDHTVSRIYKPTQTLQNGISFEVNVTVAALKVQAYNVKHGEFSPPFFCKEDYKPKPTTPSTPGPASTETHLLTTDTTLTTSTTPTIPTSPTSPSGPKPPKARHFQFTQPGESNPTILLDAGLEITIKAFEKHDVVAEWVGGTDDHPKPWVYGRSGKTSVIQLLFPKESISWNLLFDEKSDTKITVDRVLKFTPEKIFPPFEDLNFPLSFEDKENDDTHSSHNSFRCDHTVTRIYKPTQTLEGDLSFEVTVTVAALKVQAYNIKHGKFSPPHFCKEDYAQKPTTPSSQESTFTGGHLLTTPTTAIPTTRHHRPRPPKTPAPYRPIPRGMPKHTFIANQTLDNETSIQCIALEGRIGFDIAYYTYDGSYETSRRTVQMGIPERVKTEGLCEVNSGSQKLTIEFLKNWQIEFKFRINMAFSLPPTESGDHQSKLDYSMESVTFNYNIDNYEEFPEAFKTEGSEFSVTLNEPDLLPRKKVSSGYFKCNSAKKFKMNDDVTLILSELKFKAFINDGDTNFYGSPNTCEEDMKEIGASTLVVVAACLAITFSIIVFIALLAIISTKCRTKRRRRKYAAF